MSKGYFSPILLQENCGTQVNAADLTEDEKSAFPSLLVTPHSNSFLRNEAGSLFHRFHQAGWTHGSVFERNVLYQYGPLHLPWSERETERYKRRLSFRIIDFGRSILHENPGNNRALEESEVGRLFKLPGAGWW
jgi:hypothetical protein